MTLIILGVLIFLLMLPFGLCLIDRIYDTSFSCRFYHWHDGKGAGKARFDGCSLHSTCSKCGKEVMQDGQGNWF